MSAWGDFPLRFTLVNEVVIRENLCAICGICGKKEFSRHPHRIVSR